VKFSITRDGIAKILFKLRNSSKKIPVMKLEELTGIKVETLEMIERGTKLFTGDDLAILFKHYEIPDVSTYYTSDGSFIVLGRENAGILLNKLRIATMTTMNTLSSVTSINSMDIVAVEKFNHDDVFWLIERLFDYYEIQVTEWHEEEKIVGLEASFERIQFPMGLPPEGIIGRKVEGGTVVDRYRGYTVMPRSDNYMPVDLFVVEDSKDGYLRDFKFGDLRFVK